MSVFLKALQKAGLVDLNDESAAVEERPSSSSTVTDSALPPSPEVLPVTACEIEEQRSFEALYRERGVPASPFPAEKLLKLLDGLRAMEPAVRKAAIQAMDAADDDWTVDDAVLDAQRKIRVLQESGAYLSQQTLSAQAHAQEEFKQRDQQHETALSAIKQQLADLERLREREVEKATTDKAAIQAKAKAVEAASARETARLEAESLRLQQIIRMFGSTPLDTSNQTSNQTTNETATR